MRIFISYSNPDLTIVRTLGNQLNIFGDVFYWNQSNIPGTVAWEQIYNWIDNSDIVIVLITGNTVTRAISVGQEVRRAKAMGKNIVPIVSNGVLPSELGFLSGVTYQPVDVLNPLPSISRVTEVVNGCYENVQQNKRIALGLVSIAFLMQLAGDEK
ncbi:MAG: toll/interleukin-1 receptor domain-containing protein [Ignavibacteriaceae bacterium]|nr:toll/interleukin-1 receptor domain-containing protein [Ignavibacteriaceae bacterium]